MSYTNQLANGYSVANHKNKLVVTTIGSNNFPSYYISLDNLNFRVGYIPAGYEHRADLIANLFCKTSLNDWLICYFNNIKDPFNELNVGDRILIPII